MSREDLELYVTGNYDGDVAALERSIADDPALAAAVADEARFEMLLRDAASAATFCPACEEVVRGERCDSCGAAVRPGGYVVERVLVSNAHGRMYLAHDADGKQVALKELAFVQSPSVRTIEAFEREAKFLRALEHPAIPRFVASFEEGRGVHTRYYLAQELVRGTSFDRLDEHWYTEAEIIDIARQVLGILVYLQSLSPMVIHRDIKPANLVRRGDGTIALVDFGAAYVDGSTAGVTTIGTFGYMPVEQLAGIVDATTDLFALGASLLYLLTRQEPWRLAQTKTTVNASAPLRAFLDKLTSSDPRERFATARDALAALDRRDVPVVRLKERAWVRPALIAMGTLVLAAGGVTGYYLRESRHAAQKAAVEKPVPATPRGDFATLRIHMPAGMSAALYIDDVMIATVQDGTEVPVKAGARKVKVQAANHAARCEQTMTLEPNKTTSIECVILPQAVLAPDAGIASETLEPRLTIDKIVSVAFKSTPFHEAMLSLARNCGFSVVIPSNIETKLTSNLQKVPCNEALESLLEAHGLWYAYNADAKLVRIAPRRALDAEREAAEEREPSSEPSLPPGHRPDIDVKLFEIKQRPLREALAFVAAFGGDLNIVLPEAIGGQVTVRAQSVPWQRTFEAILESHGLWYRYREAGKIIRIAPRRELDAEDEAARSR